MAADSSNANTYVAIGNGSNTGFFFPHGMAQVPDAVLISAPGGQAFTYVYDARNVTVTMGAAPANNASVSLNWIAA